MKVLDALRVGWRQVLMHRALWLILFVSNLVFALVAVMPLRGWLNKNSGYSLDLNRSIGRFDFTFLTDLIRNHEGYTTLCSQGLTLTLGYLLFSAFLTGGVLHIYINWREQFLLKEFLYGGATYFWRLLRLGIYFLVLHGILLVIFIFILLSIGINPRDMESDVRFMQILQWIIPAYLICALILSMTHTYVKVHVVQNAQQPMKRTFIAGVRFTFRHFRKALLLYTLNLLLLIGIFALYLFLKKFVPFETSGGLLAGFVLSQVFLLGRILVKLLILSSANELIQTQTSP